MPAWLVWLVRLGLAIGFCALGFALALTVINIRGACS